MKTNRCVTVEEGFPVGSIGNHISAVLMREVYGMTYEEIAIAIDAPLGTIKSIIHRSRDRLRRELTVAGATP